WPPSENESGVTLRMPMTIGRRLSLARKASRLARWSPRISAAPGDGGSGILAGDFAMPADRDPFGMLADPLRDIWRRPHGALREPAPRPELAMLICALRA